MRDRICNNIKDDVEYDYAEADHCVIAVRKQSMEYNAIYWSPSNDVGKLQGELQKLSLRKFHEEELE